MPNGSRVGNQTIDIAVIQGESDEGSGSVFKKKDSLERIRVKRTW